MDHSSSSGAGHSHRSHKPKSHQYRHSKPGGFRRTHAGRSLGHRGGVARGKRVGGKNFGQHIDVSRFINKSPVVEANPVQYIPKNKFADFAIDTHLKTNIASKNYFVPTPIQDQSIPHILAGSDLVGIANTGTGKTAAFLIPLINKILHAPREKVLIMVPTRELAQQIEAEFKGFAHRLNVHSISVVGGASITYQMRDLSRHPQFVIGTPGRLKDLLDRKAIDLAQYSTVVLDEADRMLDMGFINDVKMMMSKMPAKRHTLFFSATMSKEIEKLIHQFLTNPVNVSVKTGDTASTVEQDIVTVPHGKDKFAVLCELLAQPGFDKVLIFGRTKHGVQRLADQIDRAGIKAESIHGNKTQSQRQRALARFKDHQVTVLVATDVAARGLDIAGVSHVINYDIPATYEDYVHRIGRTGRGGKRGKALTFVQ